MGEYARKKNIFLRLSDNEHALIAQAAQLDRRTVTDYTRRVVLDAAEVAVAGSRANGAHEPEANKSDGPRRGKRAKQVAAKRRGSSPKKRSRPTRMRKQKRRSSGAGSAPRSRAKKIASSKRTRSRPSKTHNSSLSSRRAGRARSR
jgi:hypothetical protein